MEKLLIQLLVIAWVGRRQQQLIMNCSVMRGVGGGEVCWGLLLWLGGGDGVIVLRGGDWGVVLLSTSVKVGHGRRECTQADLVVLYGSDASLSVLGGLVFVICSCDGVFGWRECGVGDSDCSG